MPENEFDAKFFEQFLDDYIAESDEHLISVRRNLLTFEDSLTAGQAIPKNTLNELFRSFHTIKGISAMANVLEAERLAHYMESYLRLLREGQTDFSGDGLKALIESTKKLEQIIAARRNNEDIPLIEREVGLLSAFVSGEEKEVSHINSSEINLPPPAPTLTDSILYLFTFEPNPELAERNVNVNIIRERLQSIGTIQKSNPVVKEGGKITFEFLLQTDVAEIDPQDWQGVGITFEKIEPDAKKIPTVNEKGTTENPKSGLFGQSNVVRVELSRLDELMLMIGELVISRAKLTEQIRKIEQKLPAGGCRNLQELNHSIEKQLRYLRDGVLRVRMIPIGEIFERMQFAIRDLARENGKRIQLEIVGENTEVDKLLVERMLDPLLHLVRNAVSHGIENPETRLSKGKSAEGKIRLYAATIGDTVVIEITDDGRGIDRQEVAAKARSRGLLNKIEELDDALLIEILCSPGFSTREIADKTSGRGVGMDVVKRTVNELGGIIEIKSDTDNGTKFKIQLPLTLAIADALIVAVDQQRFAVPQSNVREVIEISRHEVRKFESNEIIEYRGTALPIVRLAQLFGIKDQYRDSFHAFVVGEGKQAIAVAVDRIIGQSEIVIKSIKDPLARVPGISGATELGDGRIVLILDVPAVTRRLKQKI